VKTRDVCDGAFERGDVCAAQRGARRAEFSGTHAQLVEGRAAELPRVTTYRRITFATHRVDDRGGITEHLFAAFRSRTRQRCAPRFG
jgi:hypothetical protein